MRIVYAIGFIISSYMLYKYKKTALEQKLFKLISSNSQFSKFFHNEKILDSYIPTIYLNLFSGHAHTFLLEICQRFFRLICKYLHLYKFEFKREIFNLSDGGKVAVDHCVTNNTNTQNRILLIIPGYTSNSYDDYIRGFLDNFVNYFDCRVMNHRGFGGVKLTSPMPISTNEYHDVAAYINHIAKEGKKIFLVGFSFGGMLITRYLGDDPDSIPKCVIGGSGICYPFNLASTQKHCEAQLGGFYSRSIATNLKAYLDANFETLILSKKIIPNQNIQASVQEVSNSDTVSLRSLSNVCTKSEKLYKEEIKKKIKDLEYVSDFDKIFTYKILGFDSIEEYWRDSDLEYYVARIKLPYLSIWTEDDPIVPTKDVPLKVYEKNPNLVAVIVKEGGHLAFFTGLIPSRWLGNPVQSFLNLIEFQHDNKKENEQSI